MLRIVMRSLLLFITAFCAVSHATSVDIHWDGRFAKHLSAYALFEDPVQQVPNDGLFAYDIITPLFTDYAHKHRFIYLPPGTTMGYEEFDAFTFPVGAALVKTFSYPADFRDPDGARRLVETRLMIHTEDGWKGAAYVWNEDQLDARLKIAGAVVGTEWIHHDGTHKQTDYLVPNMNQCKSCHRGTGVTGPIGITARQVNREFRGENQLQRWKERGLLTGLPHSSAVPRIPQWDDAERYSLHDRAMAYFDIQCAHCHNPTGLASYTRLDLSFTQHDPHRRGVMKTPTAAGNSSRGRFFAIVPGNSEASFLLHRLNSNEPHIRMPQIGRTIVHEEGVNLIVEWIESLENTGETAPR